MPPKTPSKPPTTRSASSRLSRQPSSTPAPNGHANDDVEDKKPIINSKPANGVANNPLAGPEFSDNVTFVTPAVGPSKKLVPRSPTKRTPKAKPKVRPSLLSVLLRLSLLSLAAYTLVCPITPTSANQPITGPCTLLARAQRDIYDPFISPHAQSAWSSISSNPQVGPYAEHMENAFNYVTPYFHSARTAARGHLIPVVEKLQEFSSQAYTHTYTVAKPYIDPYAAQLSAAMDPYWAQAADLHRQHVIPHWLTLRAQTQYAIHAATPYVLRARIAFFQAYEKLNPYVYTAWIHTKSFAKKAGAAVPIAGVFEMYVKPHWDTIVEQIGQLKADAGQKASPVLDQAQSTFSVASESVVSAAAAAQTGAASMASAAQSQAAGFAAAAQKSVYAAASVVQSVASEYVSVVQEKLSSITSAAHHATRTSIVASASSASHSVSDAIVDATSSVQTAATDYVSHASVTASAASVIASDAIVDAASAVSESAAQLVSHINDAAATASAVASEYATPVAAAVSSSAIEYSSSATTVISHAVAAASDYASAPEHEGLEGGAQIHFKAASLASSAYSKAAAAASTASDAAVSAHVIAADLAASAASNVGDAAAAATASLASVADTYQSQAALVASLVQSSVAAASMSVVAKMEEAREAVGIHEASADAAAVDAAEALGKVTPSESSIEAMDQEAADDFESWFASLLTDSDASQEVGTETVLPPSPIEEAAPPAEHPAETSRPKYTKPSVEELAEKRKGIEASHNKWEEMLHAIGQGAVERLQREIGRVRQTSSDKLLGDDGGEWGKELAAYEKEVGRVVEGVERYATKLHTEDRPDSEKTQLLSDVVAKVRIQVERWATDVESKLQTWWIASEAGITADVEKAEKNVMDIASEAQNELGMKYAWLEDVTAQDWKRYHALVDDANQYSKSYRDLLYLAEDSPLYKALADLTGHIQDVLLGFEARLALIRPSASAPVSGADDNDPLVSPDIAEEKPQAPMFLPGAMAQQAGSEAYLQRSKEEVEHALRQAQEAAGDILDEAQGTWHSATRAASKALGATPTPETVEEYYDFAKAQAGEQVQAAYEHASGAIHDATRSVIKAVGGTPVPESLHEHAENIVANAQDAYDSASSAVESAYGAATSNVRENIHQATRAAVRAAGGSPTPETAEEAYEFAIVQAQAAYDAVGDAVHDATRTIIKAAGGTPSPENFSEHASSFAARASKGAANAYASASSAAAIVSDSVPSPDEVQARVEEILSSASAAIQEAAGGATSLADSVFDAASSALHQATRTVIKAAGGTPSPETFEEHVESFVEAASDGVNHATRSIILAASSVHSVLEYVSSEVEDSFSQATDSVKSAAGVETAKPATERASSSVAAVASSISSYIYHEDL
ncbi:hypothetical protein CALVIDRAFT_552168 [Calocera viscosa TUFC12733]|uniref:Uncharacterized protein n=1 Tax=Calocera viscosa (strain TUFC12733) TaxID=1330018 RepID=A0A167SGG7_CALVF|nr:hypothetical protein CALVIDRAFT_552168 [Calocera viscosa TUFC12733]